MAQTPRLSGGQVQPLGAGRLKISPGIPGREVLSLEHFMVSLFFSTFPLSYLFKEAFGLVFIKSLPAISCDLGHSSWDDVLFTQMESWTGLGPTENLGKQSSQSSEI